MLVHYHFISALCRCLQSIKTEKSDFQVMAFIPLKRFPRILEGWKWNCGVFIPSDILLFCPPCFPPPRYNFISSLSSSGSCSAALPGPSEALPGGAAAPPWPPRGSSPSCSGWGLFSSPGFPCGWALHETPARFFWVSLQWKIWFCFPQISVFSFSSNKNTKEISCFLKRSHRLDQMCAPSPSLPLFFFSPKSLNKIIR